MLKWTGETARQAFEGSLKSQSRAGILNGEPPTRAVRPSIKSHLTPRIQVLHLSNPRSG